jgi:cysteine desulfurase
MALAQALELTLDGHEEEVKRLQSLRDQLDEGLNQLEGVSILAQDSQRACNTSTVLFEGIEDESVLHALDLEGIACSSGSACASGSLEASHVLLAMGIPAKKARSALRISTGRTSTESHISYLIQSLEVILPQIRSL